MELYPCKILNPEALPAVSIKLSEMLGEIHAVRDFEVQKEKSKKHKNAKNESVKEVV